MRFALKKRLTNQEAEDWHPWFAWHPVEVDIHNGVSYIDRKGHTLHYRTVWLEWIERRLPYSHLGGNLDGPLPTQYRLPEKKEKPMTKEEWHRS